MENTATPKENISHKQLQSHLVKTFVGAIGAALFAAVIMGFGFFYKTNDAIERLTTDVKENQIVIDKHTEILSNSVKNNSVSDVQIKNLEHRMDAFEGTQKDMLKVLIEINSNLKKN